MADDGGRQSWEALGRVAGERLREARLQAHWAVQAVGAAGRALAPERPDDSHTSMSWDERHRMFVGDPLPGGLRAALRSVDMTLALVGEDSRVRESAALAGRSLEQAFAWLAERLAAARGEPVRLERPTYDMPEHPVATGRPFDEPDTAALEELARWFANAARVEEPIRTATPGASPVRCWPHHFDLATLIALDPEQADPEEGRTLGVGMSPGDDSYDEPYFYVGPSPAPDVERLPPLTGGGTWHTRGWIGAVLTAGRIDAALPAARQAEQVGEFLRSAVAAGRALLRAD